ncbi:hypothetical protein DFH07DRAFT_922481, partial [Mycena maculata]
MKAGLEMVALDESDQLKANAIAEGKEMAEDVAKPNPSEKDDHTGADLSSAGDYHDPGNHLLCALNWGSIIRTREAHRGPRSILNGLRHFEESKHRKTREESHKRSRSSGDKRGTGRGKRRRTRSQSTSAVANVGARGRRMASGSGLRQTEEAGSSGLGREQRTRVWTGDDIVESDRSDPSSPSSFSSLFASPVSESSSWTSPCIPGRSGYPLPLGPEYYDVDSPFLSHLPPQMPTSYSPGYAYPPPPGPEYYDVDSPFLPHLPPQMPTSYSYS